MNVYPAGIVASVFEKQYYYVPVFVVQRSWECPVFD